MARRRHPRYDPVDLFYAYPDFDLLTLDRYPTPVTTWHEFLTKFELEDCGDALFIFLSRELSTQGYQYGPVIFEDQQYAINTIAKDVIRVRDSLNIY